jgi:pSer/pThr/pTyr-binding forkhead associated (FHA) protein
MPAQVTLTIISGSLTGQKFIFAERSTCIIGRANDAHPKLPNDEAHGTISRYHCLLDINPPAIRIRDFGSRNGTYVNQQLIGQRLPDQTPEEGAQMSFPEYDLKVGDEIQLGNTVFQIGIEVTSEVAAAQQAFAANAAQNSDPSESMRRLVQQANAGDPNLSAIRGYTTIKLLGKGGFGAVYLAKCDRTSELVALKLMLPQVAAMEGAIDLFLRETENTSALHHPHIVQLRSYGHFYGNFFFTLDYCDGGSIINFMQQLGRRLTIDEALPLILQVLDGLEYAHNAEIPCVKQADGSFAKGRGLVHRDLKPANIFLANVGNSRIAKIGDYGLGKAFDLAGLSGQTMSGTLAGSPAFMPRQQVINFKYAKPEVDIWATAACLYFMLVGAFPRNFGSTDPFLAVLQADAVPIRQRDPAIPQRLAEVIDWALRDKPEISFKTAAAFKEGLLRAGV